MGPVARCWVVLADSEKSGNAVEELRSATKEVCAELVKAVPSVVAVCPVVVGIAFPGSAH